jgi:hypothetical protein
MGGPFSYGSLSGRQEQAVRALVQGRIVHDVGSGPGGMSHKLLDLGAKEVVAVDKEDEDHFLAGPNLRYVRASYNQPESFRMLVGPMKIALLSWPSNYPAYGLISLLAETPYILYLGKNTGGTVCGSPALFASLSHRQVLSYLPERRNTLVIYGPERIERPLLGEELAGTDQSKICSLAEAERGAKLLARRK